MEDPSGQKLHCLIVFDAAAVIVIHLLTIYKVENATVRC